MEHRRRAADRYPSATATPDRQAVAPLDAWFVLAFKRPGVQNGVFRKLKQGRYEAESRLDLHRMTAEIARREIFEFIEESHQLGLRSVLVIHGKGESKAEKERSSILKGCVDRWLRELEIVQAFHSAQPRHGGTGAVMCCCARARRKSARIGRSFQGAGVRYGSRVVDDALRRKAAFVRLAVSLATAGQLGC